MTTSTAAPATNTSASAPVTTTATAPVTAVPAFTPSDSSQEKTSKKGSLAEDEEYTDTADGDEMLAHQASYHSLPLDDNQLYDVSLTNDEILNLISKVLPELSPENPLITQLFADITAHVSAAPPLLLPHIARSPTQWPSTNAIMDQMWDEAVSAEQELMQDDNLKTKRDGLSYQREYLVKPLGGPDDPLLVISSYPTSDPATSVHLEYGTTNDMSNPCMARLYTKLGLHQAELRSTGLFHVDIFPRRLNRKKIAGNNGSILGRVPVELLRFRKEFSFQCIKMSCARIALIFGHSANTAYQSFLKKHKKHFTVLRL